MFYRKKEEQISVLKIVLIVVAVLAALSAFALILCKLFKKYFTIQIECGDDCECCEDPCFAEAEAIEPECCECEDECECIEEAPAADAE